MLKLDTWLTIGAYIIYSVPPMLKAGCLFYMIKQNVLDLTFVCATQHHQ